MATAPVIRKKNQVYQSNINKRGHVKPTLKEKKVVDLPVTYVAFGVLLFAVLGGAILQVIDLIF